MDKKKPLRNVSDWTKTYVVGETHFETSNGTKKKTNNKNGRAIESEHTPDTRDRLVVPVTYSKNNRARQVRIQNFSMVGAQRRSYG